MVINQFSSTDYFFNFLALTILVLPVYAFTSAPLLRRLLLIASGIYLLYFIAPRLVLFFGLYWSLIFLLQRLVYYTSERPYALYGLWSALCLALLPMLVWKFVGNDFDVAFNVWGNAGIQLLHQGLWEIDLARQIIIPIGLSFATFRGVDLLVKTYLGRFGPLSFDRVLFFGFFPSIQVVGPIIEYEEIQSQSDNKYRLQAQDIFHGLISIALGLLKVIVIAGLLKESANTFTTYTSGNLWAAWFGLFVYMWYFYLNFSGYSDLAIGGAKLFGFNLKANFKFPYFSTNISDFWNRWHISLTKFCQRNVFIPLGGYRQETQYIATFATMMTIALWHELTFGMVVFGLYHGIGVIGHRIFQQRFSATRLFPAGVTGNMIKLSLTYLYVAISFPLLVMPLEKAASFYLFLIGVYA